MSKAPEDETLVQLCRRVAGDARDASALPTHQNGERDRRLAACAGVLESVAALWPLIVQPGEVADLGPAPIPLPGPDPMVAVIDERDGLREWRDRVSGRFGELAGQNEDGSLYPTPDVITGQVGDLVRERDDLREWQQALIGALVDVPGVGDAPMATLTGANVATALRALLKRENDYMQALGTALGVAPGTNLGSMDLVRMAREDTLRNALAQRLQLADARTEHVLAALDVMLERDDLFRGELTDLVGLSGTQPTDVIVNAVRDLVNRPQPVACSDPRVHERVDAMTVAAHHAVIEAGRTVAETWTEVDRKASRLRAGELDLLRDAVREFDTRADA